ncbi:MAG: substrate-binding domain-containing protein [Gemmataceae bacterium]
MRSISTTLFATGSLVVLVVFAVALGWRERQHHAVGQPLIIYAAPTSRLPLERIAADYEAETGQRVELRFGASEDVLTKVRFPSPTEPADLFIPADDSYIREARDIGLVAETMPIARTQAVLLLAKANPKGIAAWSDLLRDGVRVAVPNPRRPSGSSPGSIFRRPENGPGWSRTSWIREPSPRPRTPRNLVACRRRSSGMPWRMAQRTVSRLCCNYLNSTVCRGESKWPC